MNYNQKSGSRNSVRQRSGCNKQSVREKKSDESVVRQEKNKYAI